MTSQLNSRPMFSGWLGHLVLALSFAIGFGCGNTAGKGALNYVALGASDAVGVGATPMVNGYVYQVGTKAEIANGRAVMLYDIAARNAKVGDLKNRQLAIPHGGAADLITLSTGTNDLVGGTPVDGFEAELSALLGELRGESPGAVILVANVPNLLSFYQLQRSPDEDVTQARVAAYNSAIERQAQAYDAFVVDLYALPLEDSYISDWEGFYPSSIGHELIAEEFSEVLSPYVQSL